MDEYGKDIRFDDVDYLKKLRDAAVQQLEDAPPGYHDRIWEGTVTTFLTSLTALIGIKVEQQMREGVGTHDTTR